MHSGLIVGLRQSQWWQHSGAARCGRQLGARRGLGCGLTSATKRLQRSTSLATGRQVCTRLSHMFICLRRNSQREARWIQMDPHASLHSILFQSGYKRWSAACSRAAPGQQCTWHQGNLPAHTAGTNLQCSAEQLQRRGSTCARSARCPGGGRRRPWPCCRPSPATACLLR